MVRQLTLNIPANEKIVKNKITNKKIKEEFTLKNATIYGGYNLFSDYVSQCGLDRLLEKELSGVKAPQKRLWGKRLRGHP